MTENTRGLGIVSPEQEAAIKARVAAYLDEMDRVDAHNVHSSHYADEIHGINDRHIRRSDLRGLLATLEEAERRMDAHMQQVAHRVMDVFENAEGDALAEEIMPEVFSAIGLVEAFAALHPVAETTKSDGDDHD